METEIILNFKWFVIIFTAVLAAMFCERILTAVLQNKKEVEWIKKDEKYIEKDQKAKEFDTLITDKLIEKYHFVTEKFLNKNSKEQIIENNQEIHELNLKVEELKKQVKDLKKD